MPMKTTFGLIAALPLLQGIHLPLHAKGPGSSGNYTLVLETQANPYAASLNGALSAGSDHVAAFAYNPASLPLLKYGHITFDHQKEYETSLTRLSFGRSNRSHKTGFGLSIGRYDAGAVRIYDRYGQGALLNAQRDLFATLGVGFKMGGVYGGLTGKFLSTELVEKFKDTVYAADIGMIVPMGSRFRLGASFQNLGSEVSYLAGSSAPLPRVVRSGMAFTLYKKRPTTLFLDGARHLNEEETQATAGLDIDLGFLALRGSVSRLANTNLYALGSSIHLGRFSFDYAMGIAGQLDAQHRVGLSLRFGSSDQRTLIVEKTKDPIAEAEAGEKERREAAAQEGPKEKPEIIFVQPNPKAGGTQRGKISVYEVQPGDTWQTIAQKVYGDRRLWKWIYAANRHLFSDPRQLSKGQKLIIP